MTTSISALLAEGSQALEGTSESPRLEAEILLSHITGQSRTYFRAHAERELPHQATLGFRELVMQRCTGHPIAYLTGAREFWSLSFEVTPDVLIPRPETELLVEVALERLKSLPHPTILDLGTGSGAIAVSLALERPDATVVAVDVSHHAVTLAQDNATRLKAYNLRVLQSDWFSALSNAPSFDLIVSNPPYIAANDPHLQQGDLRFEPLGALASGPEGLDDIRRIVREAQPFMAPGASLIIEHGYNQEALVQDLMAQAGYRAIKSHIDLQGHPRITVARYGKSVLLENDP